MRHLILALAAASMIGWIILLSGVASFQSDCGSQNYSIGGTSGYLGPVNCSNFLNYSWWITWFQFAVLCGAIAIGYGAKGSIALLSFLIMVTILLMDTANSFLYYNNLSILEEEEISVDKSRPRTIAAGAIISIMLNMVLVLVLGLEAEDYTTDNRYKEGPVPPGAGGVAAATTARRTTSIPAGTTSAMSPGV